MTKRNTGWALHVVRNPWGWSDDDQRAARLMLADAYELLALRRSVTVTELQESLLAAGAFILVDPATVEPQMVRIDIRADKVQDLVRLLCK